MTVSLEAQPPVIAWLSARDFARARKTPGFRLWTSRQEFRDERDALFLGLSFAGLGARRQLVPFAAFERWTRLTGAPADLAGLDEFAAHWRWRLAHPNAPVVGRFREGGAEGCAASEGAQIVPVAADRYGKWRDALSGLGLFTPPGLDAYATQAIACCIAPRPDVTSS